MLSDSFVSKLTFNVPVFLNIEYCIVFLGGGGEKSKNIYEKSLYHPEAGILLKHYSAEKPWYSLLIVLNLMGSIFCVT